MRKCFLSLLFAFTFIIGTGQEKTAMIDPGKHFSPGDHSIAYYNKYDNSFRITFQDNTFFTRMLFDSSFNLLDSFSFNTKDVTFNYNHLNRGKFITDVSVESGSYEAYIHEGRIIFLQPDFKSKKDKIAYEHTIKQAEKDETLLAIFPSQKEIRILTVSFSTDKLFLYKWLPGQPIASSSFDLPESNITDESLKKEIPKSARIKFSKQLGSLVVQPVTQTTLIGRRDATLYYADDRVYILVGTPYNLGVYLMELDLATNQYKGTNYLVNTLKDNASDKPSWHKHATAVLYDTLLIVKNASDRIYEYYIYGVQSGKLLKKYSSESEKLEHLIHSDMKQKGSWISSNEEKDFDNYRRFVRKAGRGMLVAAAVSPDSLTITNLSLQGTTGVTGSLLDMLVPASFGLAGFPYYATAMLPSLGKVRSKIIFAHSKFSIKDLALSNSTAVTTTLDYLLDENNEITLSSNSSFILQKDKAYYLGYYSKESKKIEVYRYNGIQ